MPRARRYPTMGSHGPGRPPWHHGAEGRVPGPSVLKGLRRKRARRGRVWRVHAAFERPPAGILGLVAVAAAARRRAAVHPGCWGRRRACLLGKSSGRLERGCDGAARSLALPVKRLDEIQWRDAADAWHRRLRQLPGLLLGPALAPALPSRRPLINFRSAISRRSVRLCPLSGGARGLPPSPLPALLQA